MSKKKIKLSSIVFVVVLAFSGASFGFLLGRSHQLSSSDSADQVHAVTTQVHSGGALIARMAEGVRNILIQ